MDNIVIKDAKNKNQLTLNAIGNNHGAELQIEHGCYSIIVLGHWQHHLDLVLVDS